jgi:hypothetical protein
MRREKILDGPRRLGEPAPAGRLGRARAALRGLLADPAFRARLDAAWRAARAHPQAVLAAAMVTGVAVMVLHWS